MSTTRADKPASPARTPWYVSHTPDGEPTDDQLAAIAHHAGAPIEFDRSGRLSGDIEIRVACNRLECVLVAKAIRVSRDSPVRELIDAGGVIVRCQTYNEILGSLRRLLCTFDEILARRRLSQEQDQDFHASHAVLRVVQTTALAPLDRTMGVGVITLEALDDEIDYFTQCHRYCERTLERIEPGAVPTSEPNPWTEDTLDPWEEDGP